MFALRTLALAARLPRGGGALIRSTAATAPAAGRRLPPHPPRAPAPTAPRALRDGPPFEVAPGDDSDWVGESASDAEEAEAPHDKETERALASAAASLARRPHSRAELATKLRRRGYDAAPAAAALDRLRALGLQNDADFASTFARSKWRSCTWAPSRIERELVAVRGVAPSDARAAVEAIFGTRRGDALKPRPDHDDDDDDDHAGLARQLVDAARARDRLARALPREARRRRLVGWLARRGHGWGVIGGVLKELEL